MSNYDPKSGIIQFKDKIMKKDDRVRLLIVDDEKEMRTVLSMFLAEDGGFIVDAVGSGEEALQMHDSAPYDIVVTDLNMPGMTGIELIKKIKGREGIVEFIIITGYASIDTAVEAVRVGAFDYVVKPFKFEELRIVIKNAKDKVILRKTNKDLVTKLKDVYKEIERYGKTKQKLQSLDFPALLDE